MRKIIATILSLLTLAVTSILPAAGVFAPDRAVFGKTSLLTASAQAASDRLACSAVTEGYSAVSYGNTLYFYDDASGGVWQKYAHTVDGSPEEITQMYFAQGDELYFHDAKENVYLLRLAKPLAAKSEASDALLANPADTGIDCSTFYATENALYYSKFTPATMETSVYRRSLADGESLSRTFKRFFKTIAYAADSLYALEYGSNQLYRLSVATGEEVKLARLPDGTNAVQFSNEYMFCATDTALYTYSANDFSTPAKQEPTELSALSSHDGVAYFLQNGKMQSYSPQSGVQAASSPFTRPLLDEIPATELLGGIQTNAAQPAVVQTVENALLLQVSLNETGEYFRGVTAARSSPLTALQIGETEYFALLSYSQAPESEGVAYLVDKRNVTPLSESEYAPTYAAPKTGYLSSKVGLYKFPQLNLPLLATLTEGEEITLVGEVKGLEREYYKVRYGEQVGYIPKAYVTEREYAAQKAEQILLGEEESSDGIWRLTYILLGAAAICILVDFLILRKKSDD